MKRRFIAILVCILSVICLASCKSNSEDVSKIRILAVIDSEYENSDYYCDEIVNVLSDKCKEYNMVLTTMYLAVNDNSELTKELATDYDLVVLSSPSLEATAVVEAKTHPYTNFILLGANADMGLDDIQDVQNIYSITFNGNEMGFLSGIYAASNIDSGKKICIIGIDEYTDNIEYEVGFKAGVKCIDSKIEVKYYYTKTDNITEADKTKLTEFLGNNTAYVYFVQQNDALYNLVSEMGISIIEHKYNQYDNTYCIKENLSQYLGIAMDEFYNGTMKGKIVRVGTSDSAYLEIKNSDIVNTEILKDWENRISDNLITIPQTRSELNSFQPPSN